MPTSAPLLVTTIEDRHHPGDREEGSQVLPLGVALAHSWRTDRHFLQGYAAHGRRFVKGDAATLTCIAFDFDAPGHQMTEAWQAEVKEQIAAALQAHPGGFGYITANGARLLWALPEPVVIASSDDDGARAWSRRYLTLLAYLRRRFQLSGDALHDYTRLFRLPRVVRDGVATAPLTIGDLKAIGVLDVEPSAEDRAAAAAAFPRIFEDESVTRPPLFAVIAPPTPQRIEGAADASLGALHELLSRRGEVRAPHAMADGTPAFIVKCPRAAHHSPGTGDDALLIPSRGAGPGWITCRHHGCAGLEPADWLAALGVTTRTATVKQWWVNATPSGVGVRLGLELTADDGKPINYLRVSSGSGAWFALWRAAGVEQPSDLDHDDDFGGALAELKGKRLAVESENGRTRRILPAVVSGAVEAVAA